jgi:FkbM family methyltransferase
MTNKYKWQDHNLPYWPDEFKFKWPSGDERLAGDIHSIKDLDEHVFPHVEKFGVAIQAGGAMGMWAKRMSQKFKVVYTFEPTPQSFHCLNHNCPEENVVKMQAALGNQKQLVEMKYHENPNNYGAFMAHGGGIVPTLRIDDLGLEALDLLMLDIEGHELYALKGAEETIKKFSPVIVVEDKAPCLRKVGLQPGCVKEYLKQIGYKTFKRFHNDRDMLCLI